jgi:hypothetical protein
MRRYNKNQKLFQNLLGQLDGEEGYREGEVSENNGNPYLWEFCK